MTITKAEQGFSISNEVSNGFGNERVSTNESEAALELNTSSMFTSDSEALAESSDLCREYGYDYTADLLQRLAEVRQEIEGVANENDVHLPTNEEFSDYLAAAYSYDSHTPNGETPFHEEFISSLPAEKIEGFRYIVRGSHIHNRAKNPSAIVRKSYRDVGSKVNSDDVKQEEIDQLRKVKKDVEVLSHFTGALSRFVD